MQVDRLGDQTGQTGGPAVAGTRLLLGVAPQWLVAPRTPRGAPARPRAVAGPSRFGWASDTESLPPLRPLPARPRPEPEPAPEPRPHARASCLVAGLVTVALAVAGVAAVALPAPRAQLGRAAGTVWSAVSLEGPQAPRPVVVPAPGALDRVARGRAAAEDAAAGLARTAALLDAGRPQDALAAFDLAVAALALVPADEVRRPAVEDRARAVRQRLLAGLRNDGPAA